MAVAGAIGLGGLLAWRAAAPVGCVALAAPAILGAAIVLGLRESAVARRRCLAACMFRPETFLRRFAASTLWPTLGALLLGVAGAAALAADVAVWPPQTLGVLAANAVFLAVLLLILDGALRSSVQPGMRPWVVKRWATGINTLVLVASLVALALVTPIPPYIDPDLRTTLVLASRTSGSDCAVIDAALSVATARDGLFWWIALRSDQAAGGEVWAVLRWAGWLLFLAASSLSAYAYSRFMAELMDRAARTGDRG